MNEDCYCKNCGHLTNKVDLIAFIPNSEVQGNVQQWCVKCVFNYIKEIE